MNHSFDTNIANKYGVYPAIILNNIYFWCEKNKANNKNYHDGFYWTYNSVEAFTKIFSYLSKRQIRTALKTLEDEGLIKTGCYNKIAYDRTKWYAITVKGENEINPSICHERKMDIPQNGKPIPDINADINKENNIHNTNLSGLVFIDQLPSEKYPFCHEGMKAIRYLKYNEYKTNLYDGPLSLADWNRIEYILTDAEYGLCETQDNIIELYTRRVEKAVRNDYSKPESVNLCYLVHGYDESATGERLLQILSVDDTN
jgi:hypothetical protein